MDQNLSTLTKIGNWIATLLLGNTRELIVRIDERLSNFIVEMKEFKTETKMELKEVQKILNEQGGILREHGEALSRHEEAIAGLKTNVAYHIRNSPSVPSEKGRELLEKCGFDEIYPQLRGRIFAFIDENQPRTLYDYEKEAERAISSFRDDPIMDRLKDYVVNHEDEPLMLIFRIASWVVRDDYAKEHPLSSRPR